MTLFFSILPPPTLVPYNGERYNKSTELNGCVWQEYLVKETQVSNPGDFYETKLLINMSFKGLCS